jgi:glycosyltransferase involved in cell wall biosynthesis
VAEQHRRRLLIIGPLPPPYSGPELGTGTLVASPVLNDRFRLRHVNTTVRRSNRDKGKLNALMLYAYLRYLLLLLRELVFFPPDFLLYCPTSATLKGWVRDGTTVLLGGLRGARVVMQFRGGHFRHFFESQRPAVRSVLAWLLKRCHLVLVQADILKAQFAGIVPPGRLGRLYNAIPADFFDHFEHVDRIARRQEIRIFFIGHLTQAKGYCDVLRCVPLLARDPRVRFCFMGARDVVERNVFFNQATGERITPEDTGQCYQRNVVQPGLESRVEFTGDNVTGNAKLRLFEAADIFVLPSYSEGFSRSILEAMAAALPSVVTRVGAAAEVLADGVTGFVIAPGDREALAERLARLVDDAALRIRMGRAAREHCRARFGSDALANELARMLESL